MLSGRLGVSSARVAQLVAPPTACASVLPQLAATSAASTPSSPSWVGSRRALSLEAHHRTASGRPRQAITALIDGTITHTLSFDKDDLDEPSLWKVENDWSMDWRDVTQTQLGELRRQRAYLEEHGAPEHVVLSDELRQLVAPGDIDEVFATASRNASPAIKALANLPELSDQPIMNEAEDGSLDVDYSAAEKSKSDWLASLSILEAAMKDLFAEDKGDEAVLDGPDASDPAVSDLLTKLEDSLASDLLVELSDDFMSNEELDTFVTSAEARNINVDPFELDLPEDEMASHFAGYDNFKDIQDDYRTHVDHFDDFSNVKLPTPVWKRYKGHTQDMARLMAENPGYSDEDVVKYADMFRTLVKTGDLPEDDVNVEFPELNYPPEAPWLYERPVVLPGEKLAEQVAEDGTYTNIVDMAEEEADRVGAAGWNPEVELEPLQLDAPSAVEPSPEAFESATEQPPQSS